MTTNFYASLSTQVGVGIETVRGTPASTFFWDKVLAPKYKIDQQMLEDKTLQGSMVEVKDLVRGMRYDGDGWSGYPRLDVFPVYLRCLLGSSDTVGTAAAATTLSASATAGASTITTAAALAAGDWIVIDTGGVLETALVASVASNVATLTYPLLYAHASGATVTGLTSHTIGLENNSPSTGNQPPTATVMDFDGNVWRQMVAGQLDKLTLKGSGKELVEYENSWFANAATTPTAPTPSFTQTQAPPGWTTRIAIGGTVVQYMSDWSIDTDRQVEAVEGSTGTQQYLDYFAAGLVATGKVTAIMQSSAPEIAAFEAGTVQSFDLVISDVKSGYALNLHSTTSMFKTAEVDRSSKYVKVPLEVQFLPNSTDAVAGGIAPLKAVVANAQTTAY